MNSNDSVLLSALRAGHLDSNYSVQLTKFTSASCSLLAGTHLQMSGNIGCTLQVYIRIACFSCNWPELLVPLRL